MQQTDKYKLKTIDPDDPFSPDAINDHARKLETELARMDGEIARVDGAAVKFASGTYNGDGETARKIELPFTPKIVYVGDGLGRVAGNYGELYGGVALPGKPATYSSYTLVEIVEGGFRVRHYASGVGSNTRTNSYRYLAIG